MANNKVIVGVYDPDSDEENTKTRPAWSKPKDDLDTLMLRSVGRKFFKTPNERKEWRALREKALGATEDDILFDAWIRHNIKLCESANQRKTVRNLAVLLSMIKNNERRIDWQAANRETVMKSRKASAISLTKNRFIDEDDA